MNGKRSIRLLAVLLTGVLLTGCASGVSGTEVTTDATTTTVAQSVSTTEVTKKTADGSAATQTTGKVTKITTSHTTRPIIPTYTMSTNSDYWVTMPSPAPNPFYPNVKEDKTPLEQGLTFGGKTFTYARCGMPKSDDAARITDFEKTYNVKLDISASPAEEYLTMLIAAKAGGDPYTIVRVLGGEYSLAVEAGVMAPLESYITTADLWDAKAPEAGGFSRSFAERTWMNGHIYGVGGIYAMDPMAVFYNKKAFSDNDLLKAACKNGSIDESWSWEALHTALRETQDPENDVWGLTSCFLGYIPQIVSSYETDMVRLLVSGIAKQNLADPQVYRALKTVQTYCHGSEKVVNLPCKAGVNAVDEFLDQGMAALLPLSSYELICEKMSQKEYAAFGTKEQQLANVAVAPFPNFANVQTVCDWSGYGAGNGSTREGIVCALAFAKHEEAAEYRQHSGVPLWLREAMAGDNLCAPLGFRSQAGSLSGLTRSIGERVAAGQNIAVVLKGYEQLAQTIIDQANS